MQRKNKNSLLEKKRVDDDERPDQRPDSNDDLPTCVLFWRGDRCIPKKSCLCLIQKAISFFSVHLTNSTWLSSPISMHASKNDSV